MLENDKIFSDSVGTLHKQLHAGPAYLFDPPFLPTHPSHLCCHERAGWGCPNCAQKLIIFFRTTLMPQSSLQDERYCKQYLSLNSKGSNLRNTWRNSDQFKQ